jgi:hypothetical protein
VVDVEPQLRVLFSTDLEKTEKPCCFSHQLTLELDVVMNSASAGCREMVCIAVPIVSKRQNRASIGSIASVEIRGRQAAEKERVEHSRKLAKLRCEVYASEWSGAFLSEAEVMAAADFHA